MSNTSIEIRNLTKTFGSDEAQVKALDDVSVNILENEFFTLLGPSGCGKTTLLRMIAGFEHPDTGHVLLEGEQIGHLPPYLRPVNTVFQNYALFPHMTVAENIGFGLEMLGRPKPELRETVERMLGLVRMDSFGVRKVSQLSGGQQQRVALARALAPAPKVLLLDEPLSALDLKLRKEMQIELKRMQHETGITFVFVTHDQEEALTMSDRIAVMNAGRIQQIGTPKDIYDHPVDRFVAHFIGETNFLGGELVEINGREGVVRLDNGNTITVALPEDANRGAVSLVVRPEHVVLSNRSDQATMQGTIRNIVYFGTDTHYHLELPDQNPFVARMQNLRDSGTEFQEGSTVGIMFKDNAAQVLRDQ